VRCRTDPFGLVRIAVEGVGSRECDELSKVESLRALSWASRALLVEAAFAIPAMHVLVRAFGVGPLHDALVRVTSARVTRRVNAGAGASKRVGEIARVVAMAARHAPGDHTCLHRSMALWWMLRRRGLDTRLMMGVRKGDAGLEAHAWVNHAGVVLNDEPDVEHRYEALSWRSAR
jgi:hypothetical protein